MTNDIRDASESLIMWSERRPLTAGGHPALHVSWGDRYPCVDYTAQELAIGNLSFLRIDMGFELPLSTHLRTALNEPDTVERNQCVCAHRALGLEWFGQGKTRRIPEKSRVMSIASQLRGEEYQQAQQFVERRH